MVAVVRIGQAAAGEAASEASLCAGGSLRMPLPLHASRLLSGEAAGRVEIRVIVDPEHFRPHKTLFFSRLGSNQAYATLLATARDLCYLASADGVLGIDEVIDRPPR